MSPQTTPSRPTQPLREEHQELLPNIERLRDVADAVGDALTAELRQGLDAVFDFLTHHLIPHAQAEEHALYPVVARVMGAPRATATMSRDHVEVGRLVEELSVLRAQVSEAPLEQAQVKALRRVLYGLYVLVKVHFAKEEEVYLPLLDANLTPDDARRMFSAMEQAAAQARQG
jgi:iron-sulfur cluster repair protein YtfE (RIC family)